MVLEELVTKKLGREELLKLIMISCEKSGCSITRLEKDNSTNPFEKFEIITEDGKQYTLHIYVKNISGAGWYDKPEIKRIQIKKLPELPRQQKTDFYLLCGICTYKDIVLLSFWEPTNYVSHNTVCSCYVYFSSLNKAMEKGIYHGLNKGKIVFTSRDDKFSEVITEISNRYC